MSLPSDFSKEKLLALDVEGCDPESLLGAVRWARLNAPSRPGPTDRDVNEVLNRIGMRQRLTSSYAAAAEAYEAAIAWCSESEPLYKAAYCVSLGSMLADLHQWDRSVEAQRQALEIFRTFDPPRLIGVVVVSFNLGNTLRH